MTALTRLSLANRLIVGLAALAVVVFGLVATTSLRQELLPSTDVPTAAVTATYPGASPEIVADEVAVPLEQAISGVDGVTTVRATSTNGVASLIVEWDFGLDSDEVTSEIRSAVDGVPDLPDQVETEVLAISTDDIPVQVVAVASDTPLPELSRLIEDVAVPALTEVDGVRQVQVDGQNVTELAVTMRPAALREYDVNAAAVTQAIRAQALVVPAGTSYDKNLELAIEEGTTPTTAKEVADWPIPAPDGPVKLGTLAEVKVQTVDATSIARSDNRPALSLSILKDADADAVSISHAIDALLPGLTESVGGNASFLTVFTQAPSIEKSISDLATEGALGLTFAVVIIMVFLLSLRSTLITALSIPLSLLVAMIGLYVGDFSLNIFTLAALTVAVGRVVDDSIVVIENIKRRDTGAELTPGAIIASVKEVAGAITASTLTTVAVFVPLALVGGISGELLRPFAITVAIALGASLLVSLTIVPVLAYWFLRSAKRAHVVTDPDAHAEDRVTRLQRGYLPVLGFAIRRPLIIVLSAAVLFVGTMASATFLKTDFIGSFADKSSLQVDIELPVGTKLTTTSQATAKIEKVLTSRPEISSYLATVGGGGITSLGGGSSNQASIFVAVSDEEQYDVLVADLQSTFDADPSLGEVTVGQAGGQPGTTNDIVVTVTAPDDKALRSATTQVQSGLESVEGLTDVRNDLSDQRPVLKVEVDRTKAARLGFAASEVGQAIADASRGTPVGTVLLSGESRDILVRPQSTGNDSPARIAALHLPVSQLQQQQAVDRATDRLEDKQDDLEGRQDALGDDQDSISDRQEAVQDRQADLGDRQQAAAEQQADDGEEAQAEQLAELRDSRREAREQLSDARSQLERLRDNAPPPPAPPAPAPPAPAPPAPTTPGQPTAPSAPPTPASPPVTRAEVAYQQYQERVAQATAAVSQSEAALEQLDEQIEAAVEQRNTAAERSSESDELTAEQERIADDQSELGDEQSELADDQSALGDEQRDLADEQSKIADVRAKPIRVRDVARVRAVLAPSTVTQIDGNRAVTVTATPDTDDLGAVTAAVQQSLNGLGLAPGTSAEVGGASEDQAESFRQLGLAMLAAIVIVFLIMVATFRSLVQPLILLTSIPFAATGAVAGLLLTDIPLGVPAMIGLLLLIGIVVTNAIVLIDLINKIRARGEGLESAVMHGARLRLRPIIMTAVATICALIPLGLALTGGGAFISQPLAVVVIGGLITSTLLTLVLVPALYVLAERRGERKRLRRAAAEAPAPV
jgi:multidrug efflux pump subunit AcrB